jgi:hypothetical protein
MIFVIKAPHWTSPSSARALLPNDIIVVHFGIIPRSRAALEIARHRLEMAEQRTLLEPDPGHDAMEADMMLRTFRDGRKQM